MINLCDDFDNYIMPHVNKLRLLEVLAFGNKIAFNSLPDDLSLSVAYGLEAIVSELADDLIDFRERMDRASDQVRGFKVVSDGDSEPHMEPISADKG
jgi:hypothetical protein